MSYRKVTYEKKVKAVQECLKPSNIKEIAGKYNMSESTLRRECKKASENIDKAIPTGLWDAFKKKLLSLKKRLLGG